MEATLIKIEKQVDNENNQLSTSINGKTMYRWNLTWDNGETGGALSQSVQHKWILNDKYSYEVKVTGNYTNFVNIKNLNKPAYVPGAKPGGQRSPSYWDMPEVVRSVTKNICIEITLKYFSYTSEEKKKALTVEMIEQVSDALYEWCYNGVVEDANKPNWSNPIIRKRECLQRAIECMQFPQFGVTSVKVLVEYANTFFKYNVVTHKIHGNPVNND